MKKLYELAKELKVSVKVIRNILKEENVNINFLSDDVIKVIKEKINKRKENIKKIELLIMDVDGVLSDNKIIYDSQGNELKSFSPKDGLGIKLLIFAEITPAIITGRKSVMVEKRANDLGIKFIFQKVKNKLKVAQDLIDRLNLKWENIAYIGDDWNDYPVMQKVGLKASPKDVTEDFKIKMDFVSKYNGGDGAVREFIEFILKEKGIYEKTLSKFFDYLNSF